MRRICLYFLCIFSISFGESLLIAQSVYVPMESEVYEFIDRFEAKGILGQTLNGIKPLSRMEVAEFLQRVRSAFDTNNVNLSPVELDHLKFFEIEFFEELNELNGTDVVLTPEISGLSAKIKNSLPDMFYRNGKNLFSFKKEEFSLFFDPIWNQDISFTDSSTTNMTDEVFTYTGGLTFRGNIGKKVGFFLQSGNTREWGSRAYPRSEDTGLGLGWVSNFGDHRFHDETIAYLIINLNDFFELEIGKNENRWGPGFRGGLLLNNFATPFDQVKLKSQFWKFKVAHIFGTLTQHPRIIEEPANEESGNKEKFAAKYIAAHRLEISPWNWLDVTFHEAVIYGQRPAELAYINPVTFFWSVEHSLGDQDNVLLGTDFELKVIKGWKFYGELLIDDFKMSQLGTGWFGNKFASNFGALWTDPFKINDTMLRFEYTRIRPYVYTHKFPINKFTNFSTGLGHPLGPNSDELYIAAVHHFSRKLKLNIEFARSRHGANPPGGENVGGDIERPHQAGDAEFVDFLAGEVEKRTELGLRISYEPMRRLFLRAQYNFVDGSNFVRNGVTGVNFDNKRFFLGMSLNY